MANVIDDFEDQDFANWSNTGNATIASDGAEGSYSGEHNSSNTNHIYSNSGLNYYPAPGDTWTIYMKMVDNGDHRFGWGTTMDSSSYNTNGYEVALRNGSGSRTEINVDGAQLVSGSTPPTTEWIQIDITWGTSGGIDAVFDSLDSTYSESLSATDTTYTSQGGVFFSGRDGSMRLDCPTQTTIPNAPSNLSATGNGTDIDLSWTDNSDDEDGFNIYRGTSSGSLSLHDSVGANTTTYTDASLGTDATYYYEVTAHNSAGESSPSNEDSGSTIPNAPSSLSASYTQ